MVLCSHIQVTLSNHIEISFAKEKLMKSHMALRESLDLYCIGVVIRNENSNVFIQMIYPIVKTIFPLDNLAIFLHCHKRPFFTLTRPVPT